MQIILHLLVAVKHYHILLICYSDPVILEIALLHPCPIMDLNLLREENDCAEE